MTRKVLFGAFFVFVSAVVVSFPCLAGDDEDLSELGIEMKNKSADTPAQAAEKAKALAGKYDRAKSRVAEALGVSPGSDVIHLKNGETLTGVKILSEDGHGVTAKIEGGKQVHYSKAEVKAVERDR